MLILKKDERKTSNERKHSDMFVFVLKEPGQSLVREKVEANWKTRLHIGSEGGKKEHAWA